jgi:hypothetical protein
MNVTQKYLRRDEAALYIREKWGVPTSPKTLAKLAVVGGGPLFCKVGRFPLYVPSDLDTWVRSRIGPMQRSTSEVISRVVEALSEASQLTCEGSRKGAAP